MLAQLVDSQAQRSNVAPTSSSQLGDSASFRVNRFLQLDPPVFTGTDPEEDPQDFIDEMHKTLQVMLAIETEGVELATYRLKGVDYSWFEIWQESREKGSPPVRWSEFIDAFMDHFLPTETKAAHSTDFESLKQEASPDIVTSILTVRSHDVYALIDPGTTLSYVTPYVAMEFGIEPEQLHETFSVSTLIGDSIVAVKVYMDCVVTVHGRDTLADVIELGMVDFSIIMGMDWVSPIEDQGVGYSENSFQDLCSLTIFWEGIKINPQKIAAVKNWLRPTTLTEIRNFLGLAGYYRKFVEGFSTLASPLTKLALKTVKFQWSDACERIFQELKSRLNTALVLTLPEGTYEFVAYQKPLAKGVLRLSSLGVRFVDSSEGGVIVQNRGESSLVVEVKEKQYNNPLLVQLKEGIHEHKTMAVSLGMGDGSLRYQGWLCVPNADGLRERIMTEAHTSRYFVHPGTTKMYHDLKEVYRRNDKKRSVSDFVARYPNCQQVKAEHQRSGGLAQNIEIPMWK
ncbi:uncharacterized protein [Nicotiana tomentosiformis]|uniref:uncharacterized protein n=1 Tax=Nicotiana tomentosiformis TaxID=4098 RepID=UPI00388C9897